mmetsp:Transcript_40413/g.99824  ORF Transcript_40413/g.99824 Transcript_40413/m.99824 type:complete len:206 (+) Transcript_40413:2605-3222(+)
MWLGERESSGLVSCSRSSQRVGSVCEATRMVIGIWTTPESTSTEASSTSAQRLSKSASGCIRNETVAVELACTNATVGVKAATSLSAWGSSISILKEEEPRLPTTTSSRYTLPIRSAFKSTTSLAANTGTRAPAPLSTTAAFGAPGTPPKLNVINWVDVVDLSGRKVTAILTFLYPGTLSTVAQLKTSLRATTMSGATFSMTALS